MEFFSNAIHDEQTIKLNSKGQPNSTQANTKSIPTKNSTKQQETPEKETKTKGNEAYIQAMDMS